MTFGEVVMGRLACQREVEQEAWLGLDHRELGWARTEVSYQQVLLTLQGVTRAKCLASCATSQQDNLKVSATR